MVYYDVEERDIVELDEQIDKIAPHRVKLDSSTTISQPCVVITFIIVNERIDMVKWEDICQKRYDQSGGRHMIVLIINIDLTSTSPVPSKLSALSHNETVPKAYFKAQMDMTGMGKNNSQIFLPQSSSDCLEKLRQFVKLPIS